MAFACDYNDLRVCQEDEMMAVLADTDPCAQERCRRLRACLNSLYQRENGLTFRSLVEFDRRQTRRYLNTLDGMVPFVMARIQLMVANQRAMPLDERLLSRLQREGYLPPELALRKAQRLIEKVCESCEETRQAYFAVETLGAGLQQHPPE
ncbi:MAG: hypothetical protein D8M59_16505 [Planctomycetes bacterium]|nr:hypothetical protein [Planctomycetota bacterium]